MASVAARNPFDVAAAQPDIIKLAVRQNAQFAAGPARIAPGRQQRDKICNDAAKASDSKAAVRFNGGHLFTHSHVARFMGMFLTRQHVDCAGAENHEHSSKAGMRGMHEFAFCRGK